MGCANAPNVYGSGENAYARGSAVVEASPQNDELRALTTGNEVCKSGTPVEIWKSERTKYNARITSCVRRAVETGYPLSAKSRDLALE